jgi:predicted SAM-dependent methyltransferase
MRRRAGEFVKDRGLRLVDGSDDRRLAQLARLTGPAAWFDRRIEARRELNRLAGLDDTEWLGWAYRDALGRDPDPIGLEHWQRQLDQGIGRQAVHTALASSPEARNGPGGRAALDGFHASRMTFMRSLPPARRILDLGGTSLNSVLGSLLVMGYPYHFDELVIIDLPSEDRHPLYQEAQDNQDLQSPQGPIRYLFRSMVDLDDLADGSVDLIVSGQTFEHLPSHDGEKLLKHVARLLSPDGALALDTPNREVTAIQCAMTGDPFINPDHKIEYTHAQMLDLYAAAGLKVERAHGLGYMPHTVRTGVWQVQELADNQGLYAAIEQCYTLAYVVRRA